MFGMNVMAWNGGDIEKLEVLQNRVGGLAPGTPKWTAAEAPRGDLGWSLLYANIISLKTVQETFRLMPHMKVTLSFLSLERHTRTNNLSTTLRLNPNIREEKLSI
ncbi:hypothetical protein FHG87_019979 [Trinorchestia longiramus]|nr:hypothetical protein FHG87_019979 [Trinorchestia longiramus]